VDMALHHGGVPTDRLPPLNPLDPSDPHQDPMDGLPGLGPNPLHVGLKGLKARLILEAKTHEARKAAESCR